MDSNATETDIFGALPCWRRCRAGQGALLVDAASYFACLHEAILNARSCIYIAGWDLHSATRLVRDGEHPAPTLRALIARAVAENPKLRVYILLWDWAILYAGERELLPRINLDWRLPANVRMELDSAVPIGASQHQKLVVIDDALAFCGGLDVTVRRWDRRNHDPDDPDRVDHEGEPFGPYHDIQLAVTGAAAAALGDEVRRRWYAAIAERLAPCAEVEAPPTIDLRRHAAVVFKDVSVGIARTIPGTEQQAAIAEVRDSLLAMIAGAREYIYIENQFVCADVIAEALIERLRARPELQVLIVTPRIHEGWLEARSMGAGRTRFVAKLEGAGVLDRVELRYPVYRRGDDEIPIFVHAKLMIVDDLLLRVGSANLNNRSMGFDSECDLILFGDDETSRGAIRAALHDLLAEHLGSSREQVAEAIAAHGLLDAMTQLNAGTRGLAPLPPPDRSTVSDELYISLADPEHPVSLRDFLPLFRHDDGAASEVVQSQGRRSLLPVALVALVFAALALVWRVTPLSELVSPDALGGVLAAIEDAPWTPLLVLSLYVVGGLVMLPVTGLILATGLAFDVVTALVYALLGSMSSAVAGYLAGRYFDMSFITRRSGARLHTVVDSVRRRGLLAVAAVRLVPVAPFTVVNVIAGAARIRPRDYLLGTLLGMAPGIALLTAFGDSLGEMVSDLSWEHALQVLGLALIWVGLVFVTRRVLRIKADQGNP